jgi:hypothetical protein
MYPSLIFIIVNKERSIVNSFGFSTALGRDLNGEGHTNSAEHHPATIGHLVFANPPTIDNEQSLSPRHSVPGEP